MPRTTDDGNWLVHDNYDPISMWPVFEGLPIWSQPILCLRCEGYVRPDRIKHHEETHGDVTRTGAGVTV